MKLIPISSLLFAIAISTMLVSGCGKKADTSTSGSGTSQAQVDADKEKEIQRIQNDKTIPETSKPGIIASIRAQGK